MISKIIVKGLYGAFNHTIKLKDENITLILGENGLGKTVILKMIKSFYDKNFFELQTNLFSEFSLTFIDQSVITIKKQLTEDGCTLVLQLKKKDRKTPLKHTLSFSEEERHGRRLQKIGYKDFYFRDLQYELKRFLPYPIERIGIIQEV